jgi:hypothetical protein
LRLWWLRQIRIDRRERERERKRERERERGSGFESSMAREEENSVAGLSLNFWTRLFPMVHWTKEQNLRQVDVKVWNVEKLAPPNSHPSGNTEED